MGMKGGGAQTSGNWNRDRLRDIFTEPSKSTGTSTNAISALLGLGGDAAGQRTALDQFSNSTGMDFIRDQGTQAIVNNNAAKGLLQSGSTGKAITEFGQNVGKTGLNSFMDNLFKLGNLGLGSGNILASSGQYGKEGSGGKGGLGGILGPELALI